MDLDVGGRTLAPSPPPLIRSRLSGMNQGAREAVVARETQQVCFWAVTEIH